LIYSDSIVDTGATYNSLYLTLEKQNESRIEFIPALSNVGSLSINTYLNSTAVFVNSSNEADLNKSANITFYNLLLTNPQMTVDWNDDGVFADCPSDKCEELSYVGGTLVFNVTHFTTYGVKEYTNSLPVVDSISLNATSLNNYTEDNLTLHYTTSDDNGESVVNITDWRLEGTSIAVLNMPFENHSSVSSKSIDYSTNSNNGTVNGATWNASGFRGGAYVFDGAISGDDIELTGTSTLLAGDYWTMSVWFRDDGQTSASGSVLRPLVASGNAGGGSGIAMSLPRSGATQDVYFTIDNQATFSYTADSNWHNMVFIRDGSLGTIYLDGVEKGTVTAGSPTLGNIHIASDGDASTARHFKGAIDEVLIFNRSLTIEQVTALYNNRTDLIVRDETRGSEVWTACVTPNDGTEDGNTSCSNNVTVLPLSVENVTLNSSLGTNYTTENLTVNYDLTDGASYGIINWYKKVHQQHS